MAQGKRTTTYIIAGCVVALLALTVLGSIMNVGDHLAGVNPALGWVFYALVAVLVVVGVVVPVVQVARRPIFSLYKLREADGRTQRRYRQMLADNLLANGNLSEVETAQVEAALASEDEADEMLIAFFTQRVAPELDAETRRAATTAFFVAAISRSPLISTVTMLSLCLDLVRNIVERCGFRPTNAALARLYVRVMLSALVIGGIEDSDVGDALSQVMGGGAGGHAAGLVVGAAAEGLVSAFLVFRVGVITKRWLTAEDGPARMGELRRASYKDALSLMRESGWVAEVTGTLKKMANTAAGSAAAAVGEAAGGVASAVGEAAWEATYPTANAATATAQGAYETAQEMVDRVRHLFRHRD